MNKNKKIRISVWVILLVLILFASLPLFISLGKKKDNKTDNSVITDVNFDIVDYNIEFAQNSFSIDLISGKIKSNDEVSNVFVNVNGYGCQNLKYTQSLDLNGYNVIEIQPSSHLLSCCFDSDSQITADIYVEYASRSFKVVSRNIAVRSCWIGPY